MRRSDAMTVFGLCFLPILIGYYPLLMLGLDRAKNGSWNANVVWLGNAALLTLGLWLRRRVIRY
jgi:lipopolysaccharide export system permease protein